jgi:hypothetical protein
LFFRSFIKIDETTGVVTLNKNPIDLLEVGGEEVELFKYILVATDCGIEPLFSEAYLEIVFKPYNHSPPHFDSNLEFNLVEMQPIGTVVGDVIGARDVDLGSNATIVYRLLNYQNYFELKPSGEFNKINIVTKFVGNTLNSSSVYRIKLRAFSFCLFTDTTIIVNLKESFSNPLIATNPFQIVFNSYKNYFLTEPASLTVPIIANSVDPVGNLSFTLTDSIAPQMIYLNEKTGQITLKSILNSNNRINVSFPINISDGFHRIQVECQLTVLMLTDNLIKNSVTLNLHHIDIQTLLNSLYNRFIDSIYQILIKSDSSIQKSNIHVFGIENADDTDGINVNLAVSFNYEKDEFLNGETLKEILYVKSNIINDFLVIKQVSIREDLSCSTEPCLNYQKCSNNLKFSAASNSFLHSRTTQLRSIQIKNDFKCECSTGFTGITTSMMCDIEINLCYSNPCLNGGVCLNREGGFVCLCDPSFTGHNCEINLTTTKCCPADLCNQLDSFYDVNLVCQGASKCKNLILGGITCTHCQLPQVYSNQFCELKSKHFPANKGSFILLKRLENRLRFKIKLTFASVKTTGVLFYNGRLSIEDDPSNDFISLHYTQNYLTFRYSLGDQVTNQLQIDLINETNFILNDGKWRTVSVEYDSNRTVTLSINNDDSIDINSCEQANSGRYSKRCIQKSQTFALDSKCKYQIEKCNRFFDLNGPFTLGFPHYITKTFNDNNKQNLIDIHNFSFEGCIANLFINELPIDFSSTSTQVILDSGNYFNFKNLILHFFQFQILI